MGGNQKAFSPSSNLDQCLLIADKTDNKVIYMKKNRVITLICILAIVLTTAIVAFGNTNKASFTGAGSSEREVANPPLINQKVQTLAADGTLNEIDPNGSQSALLNMDLRPITEYDIITSQTVVNAGDISYTYDFATNGNVQDKITTVTNESNSTPVYVRTVFAFEAGNLDNRTFHEWTYLNFNWGDGSGWTWTDNSTWPLITIDGEKYYMVVATYKTALAVGETTDPNLLQIGLNKGVNLGDAMHQFGKEYKLYVTSQAVQSEGWDSADPSLVLNTAFGEISAASHPWNN